MNSYESQFHAIVGEEHNMLRDVLSVPKARELSAIIYRMPVSQTRAGGPFTVFEGWCGDQRTYLAVTIDAETGQGYRALCGPENLLDGRALRADEDS